MLTANLNKRDDIVSAYADTKTQNAGTENPERWNRKHGTQEQKVRNAGTENPERRNRKPGTENPERIF